MHLSRERSPSPSPIHTPAQTSKEQPVLPEHQQQSPMPSPDGTQSDPQTRCRSGCCRQAALTRPHSSRRLMSDNASSTNTVGRASDAPLERESLLVDAIRDVSQPGRQASAHELWGHWSRRCVGCSPALKRRSGIPGAPQRFICPPPELQGTGAGCLFCFRSVSDVYVSGLSTRGNSREVPAVCQQ